MASILYLSPTLLQTGENVIAVELYQARDCNGDSTGEVGSTATPVATPTRMAITHNPVTGTITITWNSQEARLQGSNNLVIWTEIDAPSGVTIAASEAYKFYRVSQ